MNLMEEFAAQYGYGFLHIYDIGFLRRLQSLPLTAYE